MSIYKRGKSWYYDFVYRGERCAGCIGVVSKTVAKEEGLMPSAGVSFLGEPA